jgi:hypothetical protein
MKVISKGHCYELESMEPGKPQILQFIHKAKREFTGEFVTVTNGTTNEEVLEMLIDRMQYLNKTIQCDENEKVIQNLHIALAYLHVRNGIRKLRGVEGTPNP